MNLRHGLALIVFLLIAYVPVFHNLDRACIRQWDETRQMLNAREMVDNGKWYALYFEGKPDFWNVKPPFLVICQATCVHVFGWNELAIRLPSALAALLTCFTLFWLFARAFDDPWTGVMATGILLSFEGYVADHAIRTGDFDSLLTLFITAAALQLFRWSMDGGNRHLYFFFALICLGVFTKSIAALLTGPAYLIFLLWTGKIKDFLNNRHTWMAASLLLLIPAYYIFREQVTPGYWDVINREELGGRFRAENSNSGDFWFYIRQYWQEDMHAWRWLALPLTVLALTIPDQRKRWLARFAIVTIGSHLLIISVSEGKLGWYEVPEYPFWAILFTLGFLHIAQLLQKGMEAYAPAKQGIVLVLLFSGIWLQAYGPVWWRVYTGESRPEEESYYALPEYLKQHLKNPKALDGYKVIWSDEEYPYLPLIYVRRLHEGGSTVEYVTVSEVRKGDLIISTADNKEKELAEKYQIKRVGLLGNLEIYEIREGQGVAY